MAKTKLFGEVSFEKCSNKWCLGKSMAWQRIQFFYWRHRVLLSSPSIKASACHVSSFSYESAILMTQFFLHFVSEALLHFVSEVFLRILSEVCGSCFWCAAVPSDPSCSGSKDNTKVCNCIRHNSTISTPWLCRCHFPVVSETSH